VDAASSGFCNKVSPTPRFCADFDEGSLMTGWTTNNINPAGSISLDTQAIFSEPASARVNMAANAPGCAYARLEVSLPGAPTKATLSYEIRLGAIGGGSFPSTVIVSEMGIPLAVGSYLLYVDLGPSSADVREQLTASDGGVQQTSHALPIQPLDTWRRVDLIVDLAAATYAVNVEGVQVANGPLSYPVPAPQGLFVGIGLGCLPATSSAFELRYDNVVANTTN